MDYDQEINKVMATTLDYILKQDNTQQITNATTFVTVGTANQKVTGAELSANTEYLAMINFLLCSPYATTAVESRITYGGAVIDNSNVGWVQGLDRASIRGIPVNNMFRFTTGVTPLDLEIQLRHRFSASAGVSIAGVSILLINLKDLVEDRDFFWVEKSYTSITQPALNASTYTALTTSKTTLPAASDYVVFGSYNIGNANGTSTRLLTGIKDDVDTIRIMNDQYPNYDGSVATCPRSFMCTFTNATSLDVNLYAKNMVGGSPYFKDIKLLYLRLNNKFKDFNTQTNAFGTSNSVAMAQNLGQYVTTSTETGPLLVNSTHEYLIFHNSGIYFKDTATNLCVADMGIKFMHNEGVVTNYFDGNTLNVTPYRSVDSINIMNISKATLTAATTYATRHEYYINTTSALDPQIFNSSTALLSTSISSDYDDSIDLNTETNLPNSSSIVQYLAAMQDVKTELTNSLVTIGEYNVYAEDIIADFLTVITDKQVAEESMNLVISNEVPLSLNSIDFNASAPMQVDTVIAPGSIMTFNGLVDMVINGSITGPFGIGAIENLIRNVSINLSTEISIPQADVKAIYEGNAVLQILAAAALEIGLVFNDTMPLEITLSYDSESNHLSYIDAQNDKTLIKVELENNIIKIYPNKT